VGAEDADQVIDLVVERLEVVVADRPVLAEAVAALALEVPGAEAQRDAAPVIGPAADHPGTPPVEAGARCGGVGLPLDVPAADAGVVFTEWALRRRTAAPVGLPRPGEHRGVGGVVPRTAGLEDAHVGAGLGEFIGSHTAAGARADDHDVVGVPLGE